MPRPASRPQPREASLADGSWLRLTRMDVEPSGVDDAEQVYADTAVPWRRRYRGILRSAAARRPTQGHLISETIWRGHEALAASRSVAAAVRVDAVSWTGCVIRTVEDNGAGIQLRMEAQELRRHITGSSRDAR